MDKILMRNLGFYGYHGLLKEESVLGQKFFLDIELDVNTREAGITDDMTKSVSYAEVYELVKNIVTNKRFNLLEALAENISKEILEEFLLVKGVMVRVKKPEAPVNGIYDYFGVEIRRSRTNKAYLGLGTNMGEREEYLRVACEILNESDSISITKKSKIYETKAWGYTDQPDFLNMCIEVETQLNEYQLLELCQSIEQRLNRERIIRWGPRTIDVDILFFNDIILDDQKLSIPHPRISERAFVLIPLIELNKKLIIKGKSIDEYLHSLTCEERGQVKEYIGDEK